jgi:hypothetical protein
MASNDFVISTNLIVFGMSTFTGGQTFDGQMIVDLTSAEALLVRRNGDSGDIFTVTTSIGAASVIVASDFNEAFLIRNTSDTRDFFTVNTDDEVITSNNVSTILQHTATEAFLVRKLADGGDVFIVDTTNDIVRIGSGLATPGDGLDMQALVLTGDGSRDSHAILFTAQSFGESSLTERDWKMYANITTNQLSIDFQTNSGGYSNLLQLNTIGVLTLGSEIVTGPSTIALVLAKPALTGDGNSNSNRIGLDGVSFETSTPHTIRWTQHVNLLDNLGDSEYIWRSGIDGSFGDRMILEDNGTLTVVGASGGFASGQNPADSGGVRMSSGIHIVWRNNAGNGDIEVLRTDSFDNVVLNANSGDGIILNIGNVTQVDITTNQFTIGPTPVDWVKFLVAGSFTSGG